MAGYKSVPMHIIEEIKALDGQDFRVGVSRVLSIGDIENGKLKHLGVSASEGEVTVISPFLPAESGKWSKWNLNGRVVPRKDWPPRTRTWTTTSPNFGDGSRYGYSSHMHSRDVIAKQTLHGKGFAFDVTTKKRVDGQLAVGVLLEPVFSGAVDPDSPDLLMAVSLTREVVGTPHVIALKGNTSNWEDSQNFDWEFLPVDHNGRPIDYESVADTLGIPRNSTLRDTFKDRYSAIRGMNPKNIRHGTSGFSRYVAFEFDQVVVLENYYYGNAAYVMYENWKELSQRTRLDLLSDPSAKFERVIHSNNWKAKLGEAIKGDRGISA